MLCAPPPANALVMVLLRLFFAENHFALAHRLVVEPQAVFVGRGFGAGTGGTAEQADARGCLKHVRGKRAAVHIKLDAQVSRVGNPGHLVAGVQHHGLRDESYKYRAFRHFFFHLKIAMRVALLHKESAVLQDSRSCDNTTLSTLTCACLVSKSTNKILSFSQPSCTSVHLI